MLVYMEKCPVCGGARTYRSERSVFPCPRCAGGGQVRPLNGFMADPSRSIAVRYPNAVYREMRGKMRRAAMPEVFVRYRDRVVVAVRSKRDGKTRLIRTYVVEIDERDKWFTVAACRGKKFRYAGRDVEYQSRWWFDRGTKVKVTAFSEERGG